MTNKKELIHDARIALVKTYIKKHLVMENVDMCAKTVGNGFPLTTLNVENRYGFSILMECLTEN